MQNVLEFIGAPPRRHPINTGMAIIRDLRNTFNPSKVVLRQLSEVSPTAIESDSQRRYSMRRSVLFLSVLMLPLCAQTKKIVVAGADPVLLKDLQSASSKARIVPVTKDNVMTEIGDADAY